MNRRSLARHIVPLVISIATLACSSNGTTPQSGTGGGGAGGTGSGGSVSTGGKTGSGGAGSGGVIGSGGAGTGGNSATGGSTAGATGSGGATGRGGTTSTGGGTGGSTATGGSSAGATGTGGSSDRGGTTSTGGASGGATGTGGSGSGGATASGGQTGTSSSGGAQGGSSAGGRGGGGGAGGVGGQSTATGGVRPDGGPGGSTATGGGTGSTYNPCPTTGGTACAILPLGDSITEGFGSSGADGGGPANQGGYRIELFRQAVTNGKNITFVGSLTNGPTTIANKTFPKHHEGHGGYTIDSGTGHSGISGSITDNAMSQYHPHIVLLMIGTNDINGNMDIANAPTRLGNLIDEIAKDSSSTLVVVASIIPTGTDGTNRNIQTYNSAIPGVVNKAAAAGKHVVFLDNYAAFSRDSSYKTKLMYDNLHPNDAGYVVLGQSFYGAISALLPAGS